MSIPHKTMLAALVMMALPLSMAPAKAAPARKECRSVSFEGEVRAGQAFRKEFVSGREFFLEPLRSGWIIRVLELRAGREVRGPHDWAEVATPPYGVSVNPLLISTDWAFRAQDAAAWNPRRFRYARDAEAFTRYSGDVEQVSKGGSTSAKAQADVLYTLGQQPEGELKLLDVALVPGTANQAQMASTVALHLGSAPLEAIQNEPPSPLGRLERIRFQVTLDLAPDAKPSPGVAVQHFLCTAQPTG